MSEFSQPSEIAREALRRLAQRRIPPTPDNYRTLYHEIAGTATAEPFPERTLKAIAASLPRATAEQLRLSRQLDAAIAERNWNGLKSLLLDLFGKTAAEPPAWGSLIRELLTQFNARHAGLTSIKKRESLEHVLTASGNPEILFTRLQSLTRSWAQGEAPGVSSEETAEMDGDELVDATRELRELVAQLLEGAIAILLVDTPAAAEEAQGLAAEIREARTAQQVNGFTSRLKKFAWRLQFIAEDQAELKGALLHLLQLIIENINELILDDQWLQGQVSAVSALIAQPLDLRRMDEVEQRLKDVIIKQGTLKKHLNEARERLKAMLATFIDRLADFAASTGDYHDKIERCADKVGKARDIAELSDVLDEVMRETRNMQLSAQRSRDELNEMRQRANEAEQEIVRLRAELDTASELIRMDALTGALNRKGMDEALNREVAHARRKGGALCVALLDIDNFKKLNDSLGHDAGDKALQHLAQVVRETLRPQDVLARYGGEEFVVLLPETHLEDGVHAMQRVQRELTKRFFLHNNEKLLITFSCGIAELGAEETPEVAIQRADKAMYLAKRAGKNRVLAA